MREFLGDNSKIFVTKESADTDNPVRMPLYTPEEEEYFKKGGSFVGGTYFDTHPLGPNERRYTEPAGGVWRYSKKGSGTVIPVRMIIERMGAKDPVILLDKIIETKGRTGGYDPGRVLGFTGQIPRGNYRVIVRTLNDTPLPEHVDTFLAIYSTPRFGK